MNAQHTKGPWKTHPYDNLAIVQDQGEYVGKQITAIHHYSGTKKTESCANARLIAAAPDMYEAIQYTLDNLESAVNEQLITAPAWFQIQLNESRKMLKAALAKADGN